MRVLFISRKWPPAVGGMETYSYELTKAMRRTNIDFEVTCLPGKKNGDPPSSFAQLLFFLRCFFYLMRERSKFDLIHLGDFALAPLALIAGRKVAITIHGLDILYGNRKGLTPLIYRTYKNTISALKPADLYIANSINTGELCEKNGLRPIKVTPLGVDTKLPPVRVGLQRREILFLGRLVKRKGAAWFSQNVLPKLEEDLRFIVVGKSWDSSEERILAENDRVELKGYVGEKELKRFKETALLAVMPNQPSHSETDVEGFGLVAAELSVQGVPLVASNIEGLTSAVINEQTGFLVRHDDVDAWKSKIEQIAKWDDSTRLEYSRKFRDEATKHFSWQRVANDTLLASDIWLES